MRADRLLSLLLLLQGKDRVKADRLAARLEVSPRTIHRDVQALSSAGVPVYAERGPAGGIALLGDYRTRVTGLSREEAEALAAAGVPRLLSDIGLRRALRSGLVKLSSSLPAMQRLAAEELRRRLHVDVAPWFHVSESVSHLALLREAVLEDRELHLRYRRRDGTSLEEAVRPYGLVAKAESWYLVAETRRGMRVFRVSRVVAARLGESCFARRGDFDLQAFWERWARQFEAGRRGYPVRLRVAAGAEERVAEALGGRARAALHRAKRDRRGAKTIVVDFEKEAYAVSSLAGLGRAVLVLRPAGLKRGLLGLAEELRSLYPQSARPGGRAGTAASAASHRVDLQGSRAIMGGDRGPKSASRLGRQP
jgi:predicted DNA-binding transcriptional regulator YafY